jgi:hypothetical protein
MSEDLITELPVTQVYRGQALLNRGQQCCQCVAPYQVIYHTCTLGFSTWQVLRFTVSLSVTAYSLAGSYRGFRGTLLSYIFFLRFCHLNLEEAIYSETCMIIYQIIQHHLQEGGNSVWYISFS